MKFGFENIFGKKKEAPKVYTEADLETAGQAYTKAETELNAINVEAAEFDPQNLQNKVDAFREAGKNYDTLHQALHPEMYEKEEKGYLHISHRPSAGLTDDAKMLNIGALVSEIGGSKDKPLKPKN